MPKIRKRIRKLEKNHIISPICLDFPKKALKKKLNLLEDMEKTKEEIALFTSKLSETSIAVIRIGLPITSQEWQVYNLVEKYFLLGHEYAKN